MSSINTDNRGSTAPLVSRGKPKHERLRSHLLSEIAAGKLSPGDALVAERHLAEVMQVSRSTVRQTLDDMEREGIIHRVQGKGTFVADRPAHDTAIRSSAAAIVVLDVASGYYTSLLSGFEEACTRAGLPAVICNSGNSVDRQANHLMRLLAHHVSGVVLNASSDGTTPPYQVNLLQDAGIPVVLLHRPIPSVSAPLLAMPSEEIGHKAAQVLMAAGHRHMAFITSSPCDLSARTEAAFRESLAVAGNHLDDSNVVYTSWSPTYAETNFEEYDRYLDQCLPKLLSQRNAPTAIFASFEDIAEHIYLAAQRLGIRIPADLSIVCIGGAHRQGAILKRLSTISIDEVAAGKKAVELLQQIRANQRSIKSTEVIRLSLSFCPGQTIAPPKEAV